jgi:hypothetical protein
MSSARLRRRPLSCGTSGRRASRTAHKFYSCEPAYVARLKRGEYAQGTLCFAHSAAAEAALFAGFFARMAESDFSSPYIIGYGCRDRSAART